MWEIYQTVHQCMANRSALLPYWAYISDEYLDNSQRFIFSSLSATLPPSSGSVLVQAFPVFWGFRMMCEFSLTHLFLLVSGAEDVLHAQSVKDEFSYHEIVWPRIYINGVRHRRSTTLKPQVLFTAFLFTSDGSNM